MNYTAEQTADKPAPTPLTAKGVELLKYVDALDSILEKASQALFNDMPRPPSKDSGKESGASAALSISLTEACERLSKLIGYAEGILRRLG